MLANNRSTALPVGITNALQPSKPNFLQVGTTYAIKPCNYLSQANLWFAGTTKTFCRCKTRHFAGSLVAGAIRPSKPIGLPVPKHYNTLGLTKTLCKIRRLAGTLRPCNPSGLLDKDIWLAQRLFAGALGLVKTFCSVFVVSR